MYYDIDTARLLFMFIASQTVALNDSKIDALFFFTWRNEKFLPVLQTNVIFERITYVN